MPWKPKKDDKSKASVGDWGGWRSSIYIMGSRTDSDLGEGVYGRGGPSWTPSQPLPAGTAVDVRGLFWTDARYIQSTAHRLIKPTAGLGTCDWPRPKGLGARCCHRVAGG